MNASRFLQFILIGFILLASQLALAGYKDNIEHTRLAAELTESLPTGTNIAVSHIEAAMGGGEYMPEPGNAEFTGKTFTSMSGPPTNDSTHATGVGLYYYGRTTSIAPDINLIYNYDAFDWLYSGFLRTGESVEPNIETNRIQNHSWIILSGTVTNAARRLDYAITRDGFTAVVGLNNGEATAIPQLLAHCYNVISVGLSNGKHSTGGTLFDGVGRTKPDIVAPCSSASVATPVISAAAAILMQVMAEKPALTNAYNPECVKAILMAGATKDEFPTWDRTSSRPIDDRYGAGEVNVYNSYHILTAGEQSASTSNIVDNSGWNYSSIEAGTNHLYFIEIPTNYVMTRFSAMLVWNRIVTDGPGAGFDPLSSLPELSLYFYEASGFSLGDMIDVSTSSVDNVEHIYQKHLPAGRYALEITTDITADYALAWYGKPALIPVIQSIGWTNGNVKIEADVSSNINCAVKVSTNLVNGDWQYIATNMPMTNVWTYIDVESTNFNNRFYRLVPDP